jgi:hypothetical protein
VEAWITVASDEPNKPGKEGIGSNVFIYLNWLKYLKTLGPDPGLSASALGGTRAALVQLLYGSYHLEIDAGPKLARSLPSHVSSESVTITARVNRRRRVYSSCDEQGTGTDTLTTLAAK